MTDDRSLRNKITCYFLLSRLLSVWSLCCGCLSTVVPPLSLALSLFLSSRVELWKKERLIQSPKRVLPHSHIGIIHHRIYKSQLLTPPRQYYTLQRFLTVTHTHRIPVMGVLQSRAMMILGVITFCWSGWGKRGEDTNIPTSDQWCAPKNDLAELHL